MTIQQITTLALVVSLYIYVLYKIIRNDSRNKWYLIIGFTAATSLIVYLDINANGIEPKDWAQIWLTFGLVLATILYADSAAKQADASVEMAKEMREQRMDEIRPYLLLRLNTENNELLQWDDFRGSKHPEEFEITILNSGKGPAINLEAALWTREKMTYFSTTKGYLATREEWKANINRSDTDIKTDIGWLPELSGQVEKTAAAIIAVEYRDINNRHWVSYLHLERHDIKEFVMEGKLMIAELKDHD